MPELLTPAEKEAVAQAAKLFTMMCAIVRDGPSREQDLAEACTYIHGLQNMILAQAAARAYPDEYRLMGGTVGRSMGG